MKITTIIENSLGENKSLLNEHGLSFFIENNGKNILFDTGKSGNFVENAKKLNIDLNKTNYLVLSHAHYDHCGGVRTFLDSFTSKPELFISNNFFKNSNKYHHSDGNQKLDFTSDNNEYNYIGINFDETFIKDKNLNINYVSKDMINITDNIYVFSNFEKTYNFETLNPNMIIKEDENYVIDSFKDEIVLGIDTEKGLLILLGCSHPGILNIVSTIAKRTDKKIYGILGGTHLIEADEIRINKTIDVLKDLDIKLIGVSHCTGDKAIEMFRNNCDNFFVNSTGTILNL